MNDRNAFLQGQGSPIKDDAPPPTQGWRGEAVATEPADGGEAQRQPLPGSGAKVEYASGVAFAEARGLGGVDQDAEAEPASPSVKKAEHGDGVESLVDGGETPGGQSAGAAYPNPYGGKKGDGQFGTFMGHGGQSEIAYHGPGHLGERAVDDDENCNGVTEKDG
ncbi:MULTISPECIES: hypothetical protein [unclassified Sphingobium]|uniref:hypothetical protein n=1 Tax=unclassified Sphingobium TaxID=2611147 RepID=UPI0035A68ABE